MLQCKVLHQSFCTLKIMCEEQELWQSFRVNEVQTELSCHGLQNTQYYQHNRKLLTIHFLYTGNTTHVLSKQAQIVQTRHANSLNSLFSEKKIAEECDLPHSSFIECKCEVKQ